MQPIYGGNADAFLSKIRNDGSKLINSTFLGGSSTDFAGAVAAGEYGKILAGITMSKDFPAVRPIQAALIGVSDAFISGFSDRASLSISKRASESCVYVGQSLEYFICVRNSGCGAAEDVRVEDTLPVNAKVLAIIPDNGTCECGCGKLIWQLDSLNGGQTAECKIVVQIIGLGDAVNIAELICDCGDIIDGENRVMVVTKTLARMTTGPAVIECRDHFKSCSLMITIKNTTCFDKLVKIYINDLDRCRNIKIIKKIVAKKGSVTVSLPDPPRKYEVTYDAPQDGVFIWAALLVETCDGITCHAEKKLLRLTPLIF